VIPEETPIAFTYGGSTHAVMMATPADLEDFAVGFALTEGLIDRPEDAGEVEVLTSDAGVELRTWLAGERQEAYAAVACAASRASRPPRAASRRSTTLSPFRPKR